MNNEIINELMNLVKSYIPRMTPKEYNKLDKEVRSILSHSELIEDNEYLRSELADLNHKYYIDIEKVSKETHIIGSMTPSKNLIDQGVKLNSDGDLYNEVIDTLYVAAKVINTQANNDIGAE